MSAGDGDRTVPMDVGKWTRLSVIEGLRHEGLGD